MKYVLFAALSLFSLLASANDTTASTSTASDQGAQYDYAHDLDIAKIVRISNVGSECGPLKAQIEYVDSKGVSHKLEYTRLGDDCEKG